VLFLFLFNCQPFKSEISSNDARKVVERMAIARFSYRISAEDLSSIKDDRQIFEETCTTYRLNPVSVLEKFKTSYPDIYSKLKGSYEK
jgi:hypothetical protein